MQTKEHLIPHQPTDLTGKKVLVLAPRLGDETVGCGGSLLLHTRAGDPVKVVFLTGGTQKERQERADEETSAPAGQSEAAAACALLGTMDLEFWEYEDSSFSGSGGALKKLVDLLCMYMPDMVYVTSPLESLPDHRAAATLLQDAVNTVEIEFNVAFFEIEQTLYVNTLVDISTVLDEKKEVFAAYHSRFDGTDLPDISFCLSRFRSQTLSKETTHAEGFSIWPSVQVREKGIFGLIYPDVKQLNPGRDITGPLVSVIIRTKNRKALLKDALMSVIDQTFGHVEIILVNDGGVDVESAARSIAGNLSLTYIAHSKSKGRSAAANTGLAAAKGRYINFLDDDDLLYPRHLEILVAFLRSTDYRAAYSDCDSAHYAWKDTGYHLEKKESFLGMDFDESRLLFENFIPSMNILFERSLFQEIGPFEETFDIYEDWDYWIRLSRVAPMYHMAVTTAQYRVFDQGSVGTSGRGYDTWYWTGRVYEKHHDRQTPDMLIQFLRKTIGDRVGELRGKARMLELSLESQAEQMRREVKHRDQVITAKEQEIQRLDKEIRYRDDLISQKEAIAKAKEQELQSIAAQKEEACNAMAGEVESLKAELLLCSDHLSHIKHEMADMQDSLSWRITKPLRRIRRFQQGR